jgi:hypothetical protein
MRTTKNVQVKKPSTADDRVRTLPIMAEENLLSPIKEDNKEEKFSTLPEAQGSMNNKALTIDDPMEPLSDQQKYFLTSCIADTQRRLEKENQEVRRFHEQSINEMREEMNAMRENYNDLQRSRSSSVAEHPTQRHAFETPKVQRPQDKPYQDILTASKQFPQEPQQAIQQASFKHYEKIYVIRMNNLMTSMDHGQHPKVF